MKRAFRMLPVAVGVAVVGCGSDGDYANDPRPAAPIVVTASISPERISVSPAEFGAGPVTLVITNQTDSAQQVTLETAGSASGTRQQTGPIAPRETASLKADVATGTYSVSVAGGEIDAAELEVSSARPTAQNDLLQP